MQNGINLRYRIWKSGIFFRHRSWNTLNSETLILIEVKYANDGNLDLACERALQQIEEKKYDEEFRENGVDKILKYGIACYMKRCKVKLADS